MRLRVIRGLARPIVRPTSIQRVVRELYQIALPRATDARIRRHTTDNVVIAQERAERVGQKQLPYAVI